MKNKKKKFKDLTMEEFYKIIVKNKTTSSCEKCPLYPFLSIKCHDYCTGGVFGTSFLFERLGKDLEEEIEVEE